MHSESASAVSRALVPRIRADLDGKIVLLTGPRQSGKTTLARGLYPEAVYLNFDRAEHRAALAGRDWTRDAPLVIFDELHKMKGWKSYIKGIFDTDGARPRLLVTGSARLDTYRRMGESLAGRFFQHRLHPFDLRETRGLGDARSRLDILLRCGGFPEPFLKGSERFYRRWRRSHLDVILRQDLIDLETIRDVAAIETLIELLRHRVGATVSYASLARDLERDAKTVKRWLEALERLYVLFRVPPYSKRIARSLLKEPKYYFYDTAQVEGGVGPRLENAVAGALLKEIHRLEDEDGRRGALHYLRDKEGREIDFCVVTENRPHLLVEVKAADPTPSPAFRHYRAALGPLPAVQVVMDLDRPRQTPEGVRIRAAAEWLEALQL